MKNDRQISLFIPQTIFNSLQKIADEECVTTTALIRSILIKYVKDNKED